MGKPNNTLNLSIITNYMLDNNLSANDFCKRCNISNITYKKILAGDYNYSVSVLFKIANTVGVRVCDMFSNQQ